MTDAHKIARCVRGCTTDAQYQELTANIEAALSAATKRAEDADAQHRSSKIAWEVVEANLRSLLCAAEHRAATAEARVKELEPLSWKSVLDEVNAANAEFADRHVEMESALQEALAETARLEAELGLVKACVKLARANLKAGDALMADETLRPVLCGASPSPTAVLIEAGRKAAAYIRAWQTGHADLYEKWLSMREACAAIIEKEKGDA